MPMIYDPRWTAINLDGTPCAGAELYVFESGTNIKAEIFSDEALLTRLPNPLIADGRGYFPVFYARDGKYKVKIVAPNGATEGEVEKVLALVPPALF